MIAPVHIPGLVIDSFAGGGGASEGTRLALGRDPDVAVNHDALALAMHRMNRGQVAANDRPQAARRPWRVPAPLTLIAAE